MIKNKHDKTVLLSKSRLNTLEILIFKDMVDVNISHEEFASVNNVLLEYVKMTEEVNYLNVSSSSGLSYA